MNRITILLCLCVCFAFCGKAQTVNTRNSVVVDGYDYSEIAETEEEIADYKFWKQEIDSVCIAVQNSEKLSIPERAKAIDGFFTISTCWSADFNVNRDSLIEVALVSLMMSSDIGKYDISEILTKKNFLISHSKDNRLWNIAWLCDCGRQGTAIAGVLFWRNKNNQPQGWLSKSGDFSQVWYCHTISKLRGRKDFYLLQNPWYVTVIELTNTGIFETAIEFSMYWNREYYQFNEKIQKLIIYEGYDDNIQKILKFNGKEFITVFEKKKSEIYD